MGTTCGLKERQGNSRVCFAVGSGLALLAGLVVSAIGTGGRAFFGLRAKKPPGFCLFCSSLSHISHGPGARSWVRGFGRGRTLGVDLDIDSQGRFNSDATPSISRPPLCHSRMFRAIVAAGRSWFVGIRLLAELALDPAAGSYARSPLWRPADLACVPGPNADTPSPAARTIRGVPGIRADAAVEAATFLASAAPWSGEREASSRQPAA